MSLNDGVLAAIVWPVYVGAIEDDGSEPIGGDYQRGQITWQADEAGEIQGRASIVVPRGFYTELAYFHQPTGLLMVGRQHLSHPFDFKVPGVITVEQITATDFTQLPTRNGFRLPI